MAATTYTLIHWQDIFTSEWLTAIGTVVTGAFAVYAALQSNKIARAEHERAKSSIEAAAKAFCVRVSQTMWIAGNCLGEAGHMVETSKGDPLKTWASVMTMAKAIEQGVNLTLLKSSPEVVAMLPGRLPMALNSLLTDVENLTAAVQHLLDSDLFVRDPAGKIVDLQPEGVRQAELFGTMALETAGRFHGCLGAMEKFVGWPLCPDAEKRKVPTT